MRAVLVQQYESIDKIELGEIKVPQPKPGQLRVRVEAVGIGFVDGLKVQGLYQTKDPLPFVPGTEFVGVIDVPGDEVQGFTPGDRVMGQVRNGALAEYLVAEASTVTALPEGVSPEVGAAFFANALTALYALQERVRLRSGEQLLVLGAAGGTGTAAIQIGKQLGARVIAAASTAQKRDFAIAAGADEAIDYGQANWRDSIKAATRGRGPDVIFDPVGGPLSDPAFRSIAWNGRHVVVGFAAGEIPLLKFNLPLLKGGSLHGVDVAQIDQREPGLRERLGQQLMNWLAKGSLQPVIGEVFEFADFRTAFVRLRDRRARGKMVVRVS